MRGAPTTQQIPWSSVTETGTDSLVDTDHKSLRLLTYMVSMFLFQSWTWKHRCIQSPVKRVRWSFLRKFKWFLFFYKALSQMFDRVLNIFLKYTDQIQARIQIFIAVFIMALNENIYWEIYIVEF